jgi:serine/threonine protein kinase
MHTDTDFSNVSRPAAPYVRHHRLPTPLTSRWQMDVEARVKSLADVEVSDISHRYKMQEELGSGAQATVYKGQNKKTGGKVAIKVLESQELEDDELFDALRMEIGLLRQVSAPARPPRPRTGGRWRAVRRGCRPGHPRHLYLYLYLCVPCPPPCPSPCPSQLNHPYVVNVVEVVRDKSYIYIIQVRSRPHTPRPTPHTPHDAPC